MNKMKRILSMMLALVLVLGVMPQGFVTAEAVSNIVINGIDIGYAENSFFTKNGGECGSCHGNGICEPGTSSKCNCIGYYWPSGNPNNYTINLQASQCYGYAEYCEWKVYGYHDKNNAGKFDILISDASANTCTTSYLKTKLINCSPATHIRDNKGHSLVVISADSSGITFTDCNWLHTCQIRVKTYTWDGFASFIQGRNGIKFVKSCKDATFTYEIDTRYPTPFDVNTLLWNNPSNGKTPVYTSVGGTVAKDYIYNGYNNNDDECTIHEIYTNGWCKITVPGIDGYRYCEKSVFFNMFCDYAPWWVVAERDIDSFRRCDHGSPRGYVAAGDNVCVVSETESMYQVVYPTSVGNKCRWVDRCLLWHVYEGATTSPTCTAQGYTTHTCKFCGDSYQDSYTAAIGHTYSSKVTAPTCTNQGFTTYTCSVCGNSYNDNYVTKLGHSYSYQVGTAPTVSAAGVLTGTCSRCAGTTSVTLPKLNTADYTYKVVTSAGCTTKGTGRYTWNNTNYGDYSFDIAIGEAGHSYSSKKTAPTCTKEGYTTYTCSVCGDSYVGEKVDALGHREVKDAGKNATCTDDGLTEGKHCAVCSKVLVAQEAIPALGHNYVNGTCSRCKEADPNAGAAKVATGWSGNTQWTLTDDGVLTFYGSGNMKNYGWGGNQPWMKYADQITSVVIEDGVATIGTGAFMNMTALKFVTLPESGMKTIGQAAFYGCTSLEGIYIPDGVYTIWEYTFKNCTSMKTIRLPKTLIKVDQGAFEACTALTELFLPTNVNIIGGWSFKGCTGLKSVDMQWTDATEIRAGAFKNCTALTEIILPPNIQILGDSCFYGIGATSFTVPATVTKIVDWCFARASVKEIIFVGDAPTIGTGAFNKITLTAKYPAGNATYTSEVKQNYGGTVTWAAK